MSTLPTVFLDDRRQVVAVVMHPADAKLFETTTNHRYCAMVFNPSNREGIPLPQVGSVYSA